MGTAPKQLEHLNEEIAAKNVEVKAAFEAYRSAAAATACAAIALTAAPSDKMLQLLRDAAQEEEQLLLGRHEDLKKDEDWLLQSSWYQRAKLPSAGRSIFSVQYGSGREGLGGRSFTTRRTHTCERLFQLVSRRGYLLIQTPPQSGKSSTLQLLLEWARREHPSLEFTYINLSLVGSNFQMDDVLRARLGGTLGEIIKGKEPVLVCVDAAHFAHPIERTGTCLPGQH